MANVATTPPPPRPPGVDPLWLAMKRFSEKHYDECIALCSEQLASNPYDQATWYLKCRALTMQNWVDDTEFEEEGVGDLLLDENNTATLPRPGTSLTRPNISGLPGRMAICQKSSLRPISASASCTRSCSPTDAPPVVTSMSAPRAPSARCA